MIARPFLPLVLAVSTSAVQAQTTATLLAATAQVAGKPEVRLRWQPGPTGLPAGGYRLYRVEAGGARRLLTPTSTPIAQDLRRFSAPALRQKALQGAQLQPVALLSGSDGQVSDGALVSYELMGVDASGKESPLASLKDFRVGADPQPPAPSGFAATVENGELSLRWNRLSAAQESMLYGVSYRLQRDGKPLHKKPLVLLDNQETEGKEEFFIDSLDAPAEVHYQLTLFDGFGRSSSPTLLTVAVPDWRRPSELPLLVGHLAELTLRKAQLPQRLPLARAQVSVRRTELTWIPAQGALSPIRYRIFRQDLDNPSAAPVLLTPTPIEGTPVPTTPELLDDLLGDVSLDDDASRAERLAAAKQRVRLQAQLRATPALRYSDTTLQPDRRCRYAITALFTLNNLETEPTFTVPIDVPSALPPGALTGLTSTFLAAAMPTTERFLAPGLFKQSQVRSSAALRKQLPPQRSLQPLSFLRRDEGGVVTLRWNLPAGLQGVSCKVTRKDADSSEAPVSLGVTRPSATTYSDPIPRGAARRFLYTLTPVSRWGVVGSPLSLPVDVPATLAPSPPLVLSATPSETGGVVLTLQPNSPLESVSEYIVRVDSRIVAATAKESGESLLLQIASAPAGSYTVIARNATARLDSPASPPLSVAPLVLSLPAPLGLKATTPPEGVTLSWSPVPGALGYQVSRREGTGAFLRLGGRTAQPQYRDVTSLSRKTYTYRVVAVGATGTLSAPAEITVTTP